MQKVNPYNWDKEIGQKKRELSPEEKQKIALLQDNFFNCFNTEAGKAVLEHLTKVFLNQPVAVAELGINGIMSAYVREGENNLIRYIKRLIKDSEQRRKNNE